MYDYNSLQITIDSNVENPSVLSEIRYLQQCIPKDLIYDEPEYGIETDPHITVLYGFKSDKSLGKLKSKIGSIPPFLVKLTSPGVFEKPEYDVVYLSVSSDKLYEINSWIRKNCDVQVTYPNYTPHLTLAYVAPRFGEYIKDVLGKRFKQETLKVITMDWSNTKGEKERINMKREIDFDTAMDVAQKLHIDFDVIDPVQFWKGMNVEVEHGDVNSKTDVVPNINGSDDLEVIGKISLAHLMELPDYYDRLEDMEKVDQ